MLIRHTTELRTFSAEQNDLRKDRLDARIDDTQEPWTMQTAFHGISGACVYRSRYTTGKTVATLDLDTLELIASREPETLLPVQIAASQHPGQASKIVKIATRIQAAWFCSQCIARMSGGLAISLLELNTFAHCLSAFFIYGFWWRKPYDVTSHTFVQSKTLDFAFLKRTAIEASQQCSGSSQPARLELYARDSAEAESYLGSFILGQIHSGDAAHVLNLTEREMIPGTRFSFRDPGSGGRCFFLPNDSLIHWQ
jgi:hypothetical protein